MVRLAGNAPAWSCSQGKRVTFTLQPVKSMVHQVRLALTKPCGNRFTAGLICCSETGGLKWLARLDLPQRELVQSQSCYYYITRQ
jgi:hypothetical protein